MDVKINWKDAILQQKIDYSINLLRKAEKMALDFDPVNGFYLAFSGGKDSQCLYHLAKMAGVKFQAHMNLTSVDPPQVIRFVKEIYPDVELIKPKISIYNAAVEMKHILPTKKMRWCCAIFKEVSGAGKVTLLGIRKQESTSRAKRNEFETKKISETFDQFSEHKEKMIGCVNGKDKIMLSPILNWNERDVWRFLNANNIPHCCLYDEGQKRIGCILCPMKSYREKIKDIRQFPHAKRNWIKTIQKLIDAGYINHNFNDAEFGFDWWISGKSFDKYYSDEVLQQKIEFKYDKI